MSNHRYFSIVLRLQKGEEKWRCESPIYEGGDNVAYVKANEWLQREAKPKYADGFDYVSRSIVAVEVPQLA